MLPARAWRRTPSQEEMEGLSPLLHTSPGDVELTSTSSSAETLPRTNSSDVEARQKLVADIRSVIVEDDYQCNGEPPEDPLCEGMAACYLVYCMCCLGLTGALLLATLWEDFGPQPRFWRRRLRPWEEAGEAFVGTAMCTETLIVLYKVGGRSYFSDCWRVVDAIISGLTLLCGMFFLFRRVLRNVEDVAEDIDVPMLMIRFALQPVRMVTAATKVLRAHQLQTAQQAVPELSLVDPREPCEAQISALSPELAAQVRDLLPVYLRFMDWHLAYSPKVHGTSMNTFYRQQAGPNVLVIRDAHGGLFGGFAPDPWCPQAGAYGSGQAFVFAVQPPGQATQGDQSCAESDASTESTMAKHSLHGEPQIEAYWAVPQNGRVIQWSDSRMIGLGSLWSSVMTFCEVPQTHVRPLVPYLSHRQV